MARAIRQTTRQEPPEPPRPTRRKRGGFARALLTMLKIGIGLFVVALIALIVAVFVTMGTLPSFDELKTSQNGQMIRVHAVDGTVLVSLGPSYGQWLTVQQIPQVMKDAMVSVEDRRFYSHPGIDPIGILRSVDVRVKRGHWTQGGSTITQQLARNVFLTNNKTWTRKIREAIVALAMERKFSKDEILDLYLNKVYFGGGSYGIDAASRKFFGHGADRLSLAEAAIIAGLVKAPSNYSPTADTQAAIGRAGVVLDTMVATGRIDRGQAAAADPTAVKLAPEPRQNSVRYFTDWALPQLDTLIDDTTDPLDVWTTLDLGMQRSADRAIQQDTPKGLQGALVAMERDGAVRAMVGGRDYISSIYNRATQAQRQPGSAWKLFVYLAAIEGGHKPDEAIVDEPVNIEGWSPRNDERTYSGQIDIRTAFAFSLNTVAAKLGQMVGFQTVADMARRFGITTPINTHPSMVLGTSDVRLIDMTRAFAEVDNSGALVAPYAITKVVGPDNRLLYEHTAPEPRVLVAPWVAAEMTDLLQTAVNTGTARAAQIGRPVAGKTGTTSSNKDGWFLGFSSGLTTGVWMGRDDAKPNPGLYGGRAPATAFRDFMTQAVANRPVVPFQTAVTLPDWQIEPDDEAYYGQPDQGVPVFDANGDEVVAPERPDARPDAGADGDPGQPAADPDAQPQVSVRRGRASAGTRGRSRLAGPAATAAARPAARPGLARRRAGPAAPAAGAEPTIRAVCTWLVAVRSFLRPAKTGRASTGSAQAGSGVEARMAGTIRVGIGGWTFEPWRGTFFPEKWPKARELDYAASKLTAIEVNGTYYSSQKPKTFAAWGQAAPEGFKFALKASRYCTNRKVLAEAGESVERFVGQGIVELGAKLGPILWQFMATKRFDPDDFGAFLKLLPGRHDGVALTHVVDVRHESFGDPAFVAMARAANVSIVHTDAPDHPAFGDASGPVSYARLMDTHEDEPTGYAPDRIARWAGVARDWAARRPVDAFPCIAEPVDTARDTYLFYIGGAKVRAPHAAMATIAALA